MRGPRADLWPFYGFICKRLYIKVNLYTCLGVRSRNLLEIIN